MSSRRILQGTEEMQPDWLWLPEEILYLIIAKLIVSSSNLSGFSFVCKRWYRLLYDALPKLVPEHQITPLVLAPVFDLNKEEDFLMKKHVAWRIYNLMGEPLLSPVNSLPLWPNQIIGSSFGWLIVANRKNHSVSLFNPLLSKPCIPLPPLTFPWNNHKTDLLKGVLSKPPQEEDGHFDIAIILDLFYVSNCKAASRIAFLHVGKMGELESLQWEHHHHNSSFSDGILDVNSIGGRICILDTRGIIRCCKCGEDGFSYYNAVSNDYLPCPNQKSLIIKGIGSGRDVHGSAYLLESPSNSEPLVVFHTTKYLKSSSTDRFKIFTLTSSSGNDYDEINELKKTWNWGEEKKMEMQQKQKQKHQSVLIWSEIHEINDVIFLEDRTSICINIDASPKLQLDPGSIYFPQKAHPQGTDFRIFNIHQNSITHFSHRNDDNDNDTKLVRGLPIWLHPC